MSCKQRQGSSIVAVSCTAQGDNSILPPQRLVEPVMETPLLKHDVSELHISEGLGSIKGKYCYKFTLALSFLPLHKSGTGHLRRCNAKLDGPLVCSGVPILMFNLTQLENFFLNE